MSSLRGQLAECPLLTFLESLLAQRAVCPGRWWLPRMPYLRIREVMRHGAASSGRVGDETGGSDLGFLPLDLQSWAGLGWAWLGWAGAVSRQLLLNTSGGPACALSGARNLQSGRG